MAKVDIVTTTYRNADKLKTCLFTVIERTKYVDYKWYIWANDPNEEIKQAIHDSMYIDKMLINERVEPFFNDNNNEPFSSNNNKAASKGDSEYILFLNDDTEPLNDSWLLNMTQILDTTVSAGAIGALLFYPDKTIQHCGVTFDLLSNGLPFHIFYRQPPTDFVTANRYYRGITGACMLVRRKDFQKCGGFDEAYVNGYEDIDLCLKLKHELKKNNIYCPGAQLIHHEGLSGIMNGNPHGENNRKRFRGKWRDKIINDFRFYLRDPNFMLYKAK